MNQTLIVSVIGPDQPGLVERLSRVVTNAGGNWEGSRLMQLGGQFAGMVQVVVPDEDVAGLKRDLNALAETGLTVSVIHSSDEPSFSRDEGEILILEVMGQDRSGIVASLSASLAQDGVNVIELATDCREAPWSGERLFHTTATISVPGTVDLDELREKIEAIAGDLMVEISPEES